MFLPVLSDYDPVTTREGNLDPLGLYSIANSLGVRLVPGVRERQLHPRFLTAMAVGAWIYRHIDNESALVNESVVEPWQVYEWLLVEGIVRSAERKEDYRGLPGSMKAEQAIADNQHLCTALYLKTPSVFGFHGVYRLLARTLDIVDEDGSLGEAGYELLTLWEREQELSGFSGENEGEGRKFRQLLFDAVKDGLEQGSVNRSNQWQGWRFFYDHLRHTEFPDREARFIQGLLVNGGSEVRRETIEFLISSQGQKIWRDTGSEYEFHRFLHEKSTRGIARLLDAIMDYEQFARYLQDAFDSCLNTMTKKAGKTCLSELAASKQVTKAFSNIPELYPRVSDRLQEFGLAVDFEESFGSLAAKRDPQAWTLALLQHHFRTQRRKPPNGKNPWIERLDDDGFVVRPGYRRPELPLVRNTLEYVHAYRTQALWSFVKDLHMV